jgi:hypothetical protein
MINQDFPILDGVTPSWADVNITLRGAETPALTVKDIASVESTSTLEIGEMQGASGGKVIRRTTGASKYEGKLGLYLSGFVGLLENLGPSMPTRGGKRVFGVVHFDIITQWTPLGSVAIYEKRLLGCRIGGETLAAAEGTDAQKVDMPMHVGEIVYVINGVQYVIL